MRTYHPLMTVATALFLVAGCEAQAPRDGEADAFVPPENTTLTVGNAPAVDMLFVVDNSPGMAWEHAQLAADFPSLLAELKRLPEGLPDLHIGVTTTDLGTGMFAITYCEEIGGDAGALVTGSCMNPTGGRPYLIDVRAQGCDITREPGSNVCVSHACGPEHCEHEPTALYVEDAFTGCPRCRNFDSQTLADAFSCVAHVGEQGCGFEQPMEAMIKALDYSNTANEGFLRSSAMLTVVLLTDEDDCSGSNPQLFDNTQTEMVSLLGPLTSYRCFEFGVTCDVDDRTHVGTRHNCVPRDDVAALLHPIDRYEQRLRSIIDPSRLFVAAITGPVQASASGGGYDVEVSQDEQGFPRLGFACDGPGTALATSAVRLHSFVSRLHTPDELERWAFSTTCMPTYFPPLAALGGRLAEETIPGCPDAPFQGCADPGVLAGTPQAPQTCEINSRCRSRCQVTAVRGGGMVATTYEEVPPCLEVCADGPCPGNDDATIAYAAGHPPELDPSLPVTACWHIEYNALCQRSHGARMVLSLQSGSARMAVYCDRLPTRESSCDDAIDNDEDCLVDLADPDCVGD